MSFGFTVRKEEGKLVVDELHESALANVPDGHFYVYGHKVIPGSSDFSTIGVQLFDENNSVVLQSFAGHRLDAPATEG